MSAVAEQLEELRAAFPGSALVEHPDGTAVVTIPEMSLPRGWNMPCVKVCFVVPRGYPNSGPDCFFADANLMLASGAVIKNSGIQSQPFLPAQMLWFSWHYPTWNINRDKLLTYARVIQDRLKKPE